MLTNRQCADLDNWITGHYGEDEFRNERYDDAPDDGPECVVCGVAVKRGQRYCGASCERADEEGLVSHHPN